MVEINNAAPITKEQMDSNYKPLLSNLQGNILRSHKKKYANHIFLEFSDDKTKIKAWIRKLAGTHVTSDDQIYTRSNDPFISFVLSYSGYQALGILEQNIPANWGFRRGMNNPETSKILGDDMETWEDKYKHPIHAMIIAASDNQPDLVSFTKGITQDLQNSSLIRRSFIEPGHIMLNKANRPIEHFGYVDGISDPKFFRYQLNGRSRIPWDPFAPLSLVLEPEPDGNGKNFGSYLVFRKLEQNVSEFRQLEERLGKQLVLAGGKGSDAEGLIMGRERNGTPTVGNLRVPPGQSQENNFIFDNDRLGQQCPFQAHIRKVNPRGDLNLALESKRRIARRGIPYGNRDRNSDGSLTLTDKPESGVGLLFMCYQSRIEAQFEFLQGSWANNKNFLMSNTGPDTVIGQGGKNHEQLWPVNSNPPTFIKFNFSDCIKVKGGEYFYAPSINFLKNI